MGKNQHSKDQLHLRPTEWAEDGRGFKERKRSPFAQLPLNCCSLSLQPFDKPVCTRDGSVFDVANILPYIKKYGVHPISGGKLEKQELFPLHFHTNADGKFHCPVTFKVFTNHSHVVANLSSGHVYSADTYEQLNRKTNNWLDLITSKPFTKADVVVIQDPDNQEGREVAKFYYMQQGQQDEIIRSITDRDSKVPKEDKEEKIRPNAALERIKQEKQRLAEEKAAEAAKKALADGKTEEDKKKPQEQVQRLGKQHERYTSNEVAASFTSTRTEVKTVNSLRMMTEEEELQEIYAMVRKKKAKGYVRVVTSQGMLNIELHTDMVPRTCDSFLRLCERDYYDNTIFHRLIKNFMIQGGDPTGTGRGGESGFEGGRAFKDEFDSRLTHQGPGVVSMANSGKNTNRSQFFVSLKSCQHLDLKHSVFGRVVGGLQLLDLFNEWETDEKDKPKKEIRILRTEVFKNPFKEALAEALAPKVETEVDPVATWFSNRKDPMEEHKNRNSSTVGKYLEAPLPPALGKKRPSQELPETEAEYAKVAQKAKKVRTTFDFSSW